MRPNLRLGMLSSENRKKEIHPPKQTSIENERDIKVRLARESKLNESDGSRPLDHISECAWAFLMTTNLSYPSDTHGGRRADFKPFYGRIRRMDLFIFHFAQFQRACAYSFIFIFHFASNHLLFLSVGTTAKTTEPPNSNQTQHILIDCNVLFFIPGTFICFLIFISKLY